MRSPGGRAGEGSCAEPRRAALFSPKGELRNKLGDGLSQAPALARVQSPGDPGCTWAGGRCRRLGEGLREKWVAGKGAVLAGLPVLRLGRFSWAVMFWTSTQRPRSGGWVSPRVGAALLVVTCDVDHLCLIHE